MLEMLKMLTFLGECFFGVVVGGKNFPLKLEHM